MIHDHVMVFVIGVGAAFIGAVSALISQVDAANTDNVGVIVTAVASTASAGALAYVVRQIIAGTLVHRDPASAETALRELTKKVADLVDQAHHRETDYRDVMIRPHIHRSDDHEEPHH